MHPDVRQMRFTRRIAKAGLALLLVLAALSLLTGFELGEVMDSFRDASPLLLALSAVVYLASWPLRGERYRWILNSMRHHETTWILTAAVFVSQTANLVLPARAGDSLRAVIVNRRGVPYRTGVASLAVERLGDLTAVLALGAAGLGTAVFLGVPTPELPMELKPHPSLLLVPLAFIGTVVAAKKTGFLDGLLADLRRGVSPKRIPSVLGLSLVIWGIDTAAAITVLSAVDVALTPGVIAVAVVAVCTGNLAKTLPLTPGGVGAYEAAFAAVLAVAGVGWGVAVAAAVLDHLVKNIVTLLGGVASSALLGVGFREGDVDFRDGDVDLRDGRKEDLSG